MIIKDKTKRDILKIKRKEKDSRKEKQDVINFRVKSRVKREASKIFDKMGMDMSTALNLFLHNVLIRKAMPMQLVTENGYTYKYESEILADLRDTNNYKSFDTVDQMIADLEK